MDSDKIFDQFLKQIFLVECNFVSRLSDMTYNLSEFEAELYRMPSSGMLRRVALVRTDVLEEPSASIIRVTRIGELGTTLAVTSNRNTLHVFVACVGC
jgi:hypothetical protein